MDLTHLLPYEILQLVATWLLPRHQCRLAITSKHHYRYLYNDLLRWHAKWRLVTPPRYKYVRNMSLVEFNKQLVLYRQSRTYGLFIYNLTRVYVISIEFNIEQGVVTNNFHTMGTRDIVQMCGHLKHTNILTGCYKYMHKKPLFVYTIYKHPLLSMPGNIIDDILCLLSKTDAKSFIASNVYLSIVYSRD